MSSLAMDPVNEEQQVKPRRLIDYILERNCPELKELVALRIEGWNDPVLKDPLNNHFATARKNADESTSEDDDYWLPVMASIMKHINSKTKCIPRGDLPFRFLDLGCCPGGFSTYVLIKKPMSQGVGVSLEVANGGHGLSIPYPLRVRFEIHWGDLTYFDICAPPSRPAPPSAPALVETPFSPGGFKLAMLDGHHRRPQESELTHPWDIDRLLLAQLIIALESLDVGGTLVLTLHVLESSTTARILYMVDKLSKAAIVFKPHAHSTRANFYAIALGFGEGEHRDKRTEYLRDLKNVWWELTYGGPSLQGRWLLEGDLDFIVDVETLVHTYLNRLIRLGKGVWRVQSNALTKMFTRIRAKSKRSYAESGQLS